MSEQGDFFTPEEVETQIEQVSQLRAGQRADARAMAYLRSFYRLDARQEQEALGRIWKRIRDAAPSSAARPAVLPEQESEEDIPMQKQPVLFSNQAPPAPGRTLRQRLGMLAAVIVLLALVGSLALLFSTTRPQPGGPAAGGPHPLASSVATHTPVPPPTPTAGSAATHTPVYNAPFVVTSIAMTVTPGSVAGFSCGTSVTVKYTATIHVAAHSPGGTVTFGYTVNNGRSQNMASVHFAAGQTSKKYTFTWSGPLPLDHTYPEPGGISVTGPNALISPLLGPSGMCR
ncbi:MAG TPA: hypothetical protein VGF67_14780 [Ktedonobacteraceae bacterium]